MTNADEVIAAIDNALMDFDTSPDAMRWFPGPADDGPALKASAVGWHCDRSRYFDRDSRPITFEELAERFSDDQPVAVTSVGAATVSTVWLGRDHSFGSGPPMIFETMVFGGRLDSEMDRYSTESEATAGHDAMVARVRAARFRWLRWWPRRRS